MKQAVNPRAFANNDYNRLHKQIVWAPCDLTQAYNLKEMFGGKRTQTN